MPINEADRQRLLELVPKLMLLADWIDVKTGSIEDEVQQDLRWLSEQLPLLLEELEQLTLALELTEPIYDRITQERQQALDQLAQAKAEVEQWKADFFKFGQIMGIEAPKGVEIPQYIIEALQALSPSETKDAKD